MKRTITLAVLLGLVGTATASTIAHWDFEEGVDGVAHAGVWDNHYLDISGNGNHMSSWIAGENPTATSDTSGGPGNNLGLEFNKGELDSVGTFASSGGLNTMDFNSGWTVEVTFKLTELGLHQQIMAKNGKPAGGAEPPFWMKILPWNNHLEVLAIDDNSNIRVTASANPLVVDEWYSAAARYDGAGMDLWLKGPSDTEYQFQNAVLFTDGAALANDDYWMLGRGVWDNNPVDHVNAFVDEARISDHVVAPGDFIAIPEPATLGLFGLIGGGMLWIRKRFAN